MLLHQARGDYEPSYVSNLLHTQGLEDVDDLVKKSAAVGYAAGSETVSKLAR